MFVLTLQIYLIVYLESNPKPTRKLPKKCHQKTKKTQTSNKKKPNIIYSTTKPN